MRKLFSQRGRHKPVRNTFQLGSMELELRSRLWDLLTLSYWNQPNRGDLNAVENRWMKGFLQKLWHNYIKKPVDTIGWYYPDALKEIRKYFFGCDWNEVYDLIEFVAAEKTTLAEAVAT